MYTNVSSDDNDGCSNCKIDRGYVCVATNPSQCTPKCGDGIVILPEACDDNNTKTNDGCSPSCTVDNGWTCPGTNREKFIFIR